jgi:hypothetical protein
MVSAILIWYFLLIVGAMATVGGLVVWMIGKSRRTGSRLGFKTSTTVSHPEVWEYSNKLYGKLFVAIGIADLSVSLIFNGLFTSNAQAASYFAMGIALAILIAFEASIALSMRKAREISRREEADSLFLQE